MARGQADSALGDELAGKYRFIAQIGRGGMADVYLSVTQGEVGEFQKLVVIKLLRADLAEEAEFRQMFLHEARLAARLNHPNVVQTNDVGEDRGRYYLAMEYLDGQSLERIRRMRGADERSNLRMQLQMLTYALSGLHYAHELNDFDGRPLNVVHRDVTPSNMLVSYTGQVKLVDFGIAKAFDPAHEARPGAIKGKTAYMAPEAFTARASIDRRADIYSAGVVLWEMLTGRRMWKGLPPQERLQLAVAGRIQPLRDVAPRVPPELERIVLKALAPQREDRYPTAAALQADLEGYLVEHPPRVTEREIGNAVSQLFQTERKRIHAIIEQQLKGPGPVPGPLPNLSGVPSSASKVVTGFDTSMIRNTPPPGLPPPPAAPAPRSPLLLAVAVGGVAVAAVLAAVLVLRPSDGARGAGASSQPSGRPAKAVRGVTDGEVLLGMSAPFSGPARELGTRMKLGVETGFADLNAGGGVAGRMLKLVALDDGYEGPRALANMGELLDQRQAFAVIGNVGTPTAVVTVPFAVSRSTIFFGAFTGSNLLRKDPPDRYVFNYRASYEEETAKMLHYLLEVRRLPARSIVVFAQHDAYGDAGYDGAAKTLRKSGKGEGDLLRVNYERNTADVDAAVKAILEYHAETVTTKNAAGKDVIRPKHPVRAIIMVSTYKAAVKFIQKLKDEKLDATFLNVSFVGSNALAEGLKELGPGYADGVIVTQVVPHYDSMATGVIRYREALKRYHPDQQPDFISLEGFVVANLFAEGLRRAGREVDTEKLVDALEGVRDFDLGIGTVMHFGMSDHQSSHKVWGTIIDEQAQFRPLDME